MRRRKHLHITHDIPAAIRERARRNAKLRRKANKQTEKERTREVRELTKRSALDWLPSWLRPKR